jgi:alpha-1,2-mannosyltransferase
MLERVSSRFNIDLHPPSIVFIYLSLRHYVLSSTYSHFTLLGQSLGSLVLAHEAFSLLVPDIYIDTMGYAFTLFFSKWLFPNVPTAAYVHYPTISTDMLSSLDDKTGTKGINSGAGVGWKGWAKKHYWNIFARLYSRCGRDIDIVMTNSSWTESHIKALWAPSRLAKHPKSPYSLPMILYPAVAVSSLESIPITTPRPQPAQLLYIAQFRPEKNHALILRAFAKYIHSLESSATGDPDSPTPATPSPHNKLPQLILIGSIRSPSTSPDSTHIYSLRLLARELHLSDANLTFVTDAPWSLIQSYLSRATVGVNGMWNEHFGMGVVEYQAAGLIPVVHASGGPQKDIVIEIDTGSEKAGGSGPTGFHADDVESFAAAFGKAISLSEEQKVAMRLRGRASAKRFSDEAFMERWVGVVEKLVAISKGGRGRPPP